MAETNIVCRADRMNMERISARALVFGGGAFWMIAGFAVYFNILPAESSVNALGGAAIPFVFALTTLLLGRYSERAASLFLLFGAAVAIAVGFTYAWGLSTWAIMMIVLIGPMIGASVAYALAAKMERVCMNPDSINSLASAGVAS